MSDDMRWKAVATRSDEAIAAVRPFFFGVRTTGIYCRPGCASRTPLRKNVAFFDTPRQAAEAGFRACRRCRPDSSGSTAEKSSRLAKAVRACRRLEFEEPEPTLENLAEEAELSPAHFQKLFKAVVGLSPHAYAAAVRSGRLLEALSKGMTVTDAVYEAGYSTSSRAYEEWKSRSVLSPGDHRRGGAGLALDFTVVPCRLGWVLVAATAKGIASVLLGDSPEGVSEELKGQFPDARLQEIPAGESEAVRQAVEALDHPDHWADLPLDIQGTAFQKRVWMALREVPAGETATYADIAGRIGRPESVRAVANACGANKIALLVPCHRIIRSDGNLGGYRWGTDRKEIILEEERRPGSRQTGKTV